jgi:hypothetical protein
MGPHGTSQVALDSPFKCRREQPGRKLSHAVRVPPKVHAPLNSRDLRGLDSCLVSVHALESCTNGLARGAERYMVRSVARQRSVRGE